MINKLALGFLMGTSSMCVFAQTTDIQVPQNDGYSQDSRGTVPRSGYGLCWRSGTWTPDDAVTGCDGALKSPIPNPIAPEVQNSLGNEQSAKRCDFTATLESGQTFAFGKAILNAQAKKRLADSLLPQLAQCKSITSLTITGHTDNIGSHQANQQLSEKRALAVAAFLKSHGVTAPMHTHGAGETQPITSCDSILPISSRITCLAPNRRVLLDVQGTQK